MGQEEPLIPRKTAPAITDNKRCSGCGRCIAACPLRLYTFEHVGYRKQAIKPPTESCSLCLKCQSSCPLKLLTADKPA
jgi:ferredoxin